MNLVSFSENQPRKQTPLLEELFQKYPAGMEHPKEITIVTDTGKIHVKVPDHLRNQRYRCDKCHCIVTKTKGKIVKHNCSVQVSKKST